MFQLCGFYTEPARVTVAAPVSHMGVAIEIGGPCCGRSYSKSPTVGGPN